MLPAFPDEVLSEWFYRHGSHAHSYDWLNYRELSFRREVWKTRRILDDVRSWPHEDPTELFSATFLNEPVIQSEWLVSRMKEVGSWPSPPIVLANPNALREPSGCELGRPYHLLEGHRRIGYLRAIVHSQGVVMPEHSLWVVTVDANAVFDFWPLNKLSES